MKSIILSLLSVCAGLSHAVDYTYNDAGQLLAESYANGAHVLYDYDKRGAFLKRQVLAPKVNPSADLRVTVSADPNPAVQSETVIVTISVENLGPDVATDVEVTSNLPGTLAINRASSSQGTCVVSGQQITCALGTMPNGAIATATVEATALATGLINLTASVGSSGVDPNAANDTGNASVNVNAVATTDLSLTLHDGPDPTFLPGAIVYEIDVENLSSDPATDVQVTFGTPIGLTVRSVETSQGTATPSSGAVTVDLGTLGGGGIVVIKVIADTSGIGVFEASATVTQTEIDLNPDNNSDSGNTTVLEGTLVVTNTNDAGPGSLRDALDRANRQDNVDIIVFEIPGDAIPSIVPLALLPTITRPLILDGFSQAAGRVELDLSSTSGLAVSGNTITIRGLVINGSGRDGLNLGVRFGNARNLKVYGCYSGTDKTGLIASPNATFGIRLQGVEDVRIGGPERWQRNVISGNSIGIFAHDSTTDLHIENNYIGMDVTGMAAIPNTGDGIEMNGPDGFMVFNNVISGNNGTGVDVRVAVDNVRIQGNKIGVDATGTTAFGNSVGFSMTRSGGSNILIGGANPAQRNILSGNQFSNAIVPSEATVVGNFIGTDVSGEQALGGRGISPRSGTRIGLPIPGGGNLISGNAEQGIDGNFDDQMIVQNNLIGTDVTGTQALPNVGVGVNLRFCDEVQIGGTGPLMQNIIAGNDSHGIFFEGGPTSSSAISFGGKIEGNHLGADPDGNALPNGGDGIRIEAGRNYAIGGREPNAGNTIAFNTGDGVRVANLTTGVDERHLVFGNAIEGNSIHSNGGLGINLGNDAGITPNDAQDVDDPVDGGNRLQNFPMITTARDNVSGILNSAPNQTYRIEFFVNSAADPSGNGEGEMFLGFVETTTDGNGDANFAFGPTILAEDTFVSATATDPDGNTSEFGPALRVVAPSGFPDADNDGMSDAYELEHFGSETGGDPDEDLDGDGHTNLFEFLTLTDPNSAESAFEASLANVGNSATITIQTEIGRVYQLHESSDMITFFSLGDPVVGDGSLVELVQPNPGVRRFYQITVSLP